ncbi:hypothetical protein CHARACLAT_012886 [Characodon lateralis]|uniref:Uncharacterized protein n=1 Tax=Characodon lateralis TaxID=208331 RepID=A0ABU7EC92_9TELE|nr:hypothetical protein [Characodon lateralis]
MSDDQRPNSQVDNPEVVTSARHLLNLLTNASIPGTVRPGVQTAQEPSRRQGTSQERERCPTQYPHRND